MRKNLTLTLNFDNFAIINNYLHPKKINIVFK